MAARLFRSASDVPMLASAGAASRRHASLIGDGREVAAETGLKAQHSLVQFMEVGMKHVSAALLSGIIAVSCAPAVVVTPEPAVVAAPTATVAMTPVSRGPDGMVVAHANLSGWGPAPAALPAGAQIIVLDGDPGKAELFTMRVRVPHNYLVRPHSHPTWEHVTVISGLLHIGMGTSVTMSSASELRAGSFMAIPARMNHFAHAVGETVFQIHGMGPFQVNYVNRADDPRNR